MQHHVALLLRSTLRVVSELATRFRHRSRSAQPVGNCLYGRTANSAVMPILSSTKPGPGWRQPLWL